MAKLVLLLATLVSFGAAADRVAYDPLDATGGVTVSDHEIPYRGERVVPLRLYLPDDKTKPAPVILFSHGLGGSRENNQFTCRHWAGRGFAVVAMQHAGSDEKVWRGVAARERMKTMRAAASAESFNRRVEDVPAVLDTIAKWNAAGGKYPGRFDLVKVGMSGHSFGAVTTQAVSGQVQGLAGKKYTDKRIDAALAFSPSVPTIGNATNAFGKVSIPWMLMTGTNDKSVMSRATPESRREVYKALPGGSGHHFELVLDGAEHMAFSDRTLVGTKHRNPKHHIAIKAFSAAFWDAYLRDDVKAIAWLKGDGAKAAAGEKDIWQFK